MKKTIVHIFELLTILILIAILVLFFPQITPDDLIIIILILVGMYVGVNFESIKEMFKK